MASLSEDECRGKCDASQIYLLTGKNYRISRSIKVQWFFQHFNCVVTPNPDNTISSSDEELEVLSVLCKGPADYSNKCTVVPSTLITFLGRIYKFVFCLDVSQSLANVDILSGKVVNEISFESFQNCIRGLVLPFSAPGSTLTLSPELHITVLGYSGVMDYGTVQVLVEGCLVTQDNVESFLASVHDKLQHIENKNASVVQLTGCQDANEMQDKLDGKRHLTTEMSIVAMLKMSLLALQLLPGNASGGIVIISDGVFGLPSAAVVHQLLAQLRSHTVCCSFVKVGSPFQAQCSFGYIPNTDLMQFLALATSGAYLCKAPPVEELTEKAESTVRKDLPPLNFYHKVFLCWSFQREYDLSKISSWEDDEHIMELLAEKRSFVQVRTQLHQWKKVLSEPLMRKRHLERNLKTTISSVLSVRLREGYCIEDISFHRGGKELVVKLLLLWKQNVHIEYTASASWPVATTNPQTQIEVVVQGSYEFLHDVYSKQLYSMKGYRANVVETFNHTLKNLEMTDALLVSLQSFSSNYVYYTIPEIARRGVPLFYLPPNSLQPVLSLEQGKSKKSSKSQEAQFAVFWKTILSLDVNIWQRWMHCHRINMILEHDRPLPKSLYLPLNNDRFYHIQCRMALSSLAALLKQWSSFVLLENHSYIKFVEGENPEGPPRSFCIVRLSSKAPCVVIRLAFLGGMPGKDRHEVVNSLRDRIEEITAQFASPGNLSKDSNQDNKNQVERQIKEPLVCTKLLHKPLDRILVRYDEQPEEFLVNPHHSQKSEIIETFEPWVHRAKGAVDSPLKVLSRYLYHQRWVFTLRYPGNGSTSSPNTVSKILRRLTNLRQDEGYKFVASNLGVTTMSKEFWVKAIGGTSDPLSTCVVQFVMFPPLTSSTHNRVVGWALESKLPEDDRDLQLVTEVWVEPQEGVIVESETPEYLIGKHYYEIPAKIFEVDLEYISTWLTYDHLRRMCDDHVIGLPDQSIVDVALPPNDPERKSVIYEVPFPFNIMKILSRSKRAELLFSTLIENDRSVSSRSSCRRANDVFFDYILERVDRLHERKLTLTLEDSQRFSSLIRSGRGRGKHDKNVTWRCFARVDNGHLLLTFLPASYQSLQNFAKAPTELKGERSNSEHTSLPTRESFETGYSDHLDGDTSKETFGKFWCRRRRSGKRSCVDLSVFVFDFALSSLTESGLSNDRDLVNTILLDYRNKLDQFDQVSLLDKSKELRSHCLAIYELFLWCFVSTVFESLRRSEHVDDDNLEEVLAICGDLIPEEIDITEFLGNICSHIKQPAKSASPKSYSSDEDDLFENNGRQHEESAINFLRSNCDSSVTSSQLDGKCEELSGLHDFIQRKFSTLLGKYFAPIPNKRDHYFYSPHFRHISSQSDDDEIGEDSIDTGSEAGFDVVFESEEEKLGADECGGDYLLDQHDKNADDEDGPCAYDNLGSGEDKISDYPSDRSDFQSSVEDTHVMKELRDLEEQYNVPLFLNLSCTIRDRSHLSSTMVSTPAEYLPVCLADILDQAKRDPDQCIDTSISSLLITLDLICLVPPREPDYSRFKNRGYCQTRSNSVSSMSSISDTPQEKIVRFDEITGANKSVSVTASHDRDTNYTGSNLSRVQTESILDMKDDINWLLRDEIVFSLCHAPSINLSMLESVTQHIQESQTLELKSSRFSSIRLDFVLDAEQSLETFVKELDKIRIGGCQLSNLGNYYYLRLSSSTSLHVLPRSLLELNTMDPLSTGNEELSKAESEVNEDDSLVDFTAGFSSDSHSASHAEEEMKMHVVRSSMGYHSQSRDSFSELWLILKKTESDVLDVFFHTREGHEGEYYYYLFTEATNEVKKLCHLVNQELLLRYVYDTRICHPLLQPKSDEDIWNETWSYSTSPHSVPDVRDGSKVVHPEYRFQPGYFKCPVRWSKNFPIHFRLKGNTPRRTAAERAIKALQTVLDKFSLNETTHMYVYKEKTGDIYYFSLNESLCVSKEAQVEGDNDNADYGQDESYQSQPMSRSSSYLSLSKAGTTELEDDLEECAKKRSAGVTGDKDTASLNGTLPISEHVEQCIVLSVHGVTEPSDEIKKDLVSVLQKRLDDFTLEMLTMSLARNPNTKLALQDVKFIQPSGSSPMPYIQLVLPQFASKNLHPFLFFFKQHLLHYLHTPRYTTKVEAYHFKKFIRGEGHSEALPENDVFIFNTPYAPGARGVACLSMNVTDSRGITIHVTPDRKEMGFLNHALNKNLEEATHVKNAAQSYDLSDDAVVLEILVWERGNVGIGQLEGRLQNSVRHALCDVLIEYYLLMASFSFIPERYFANTYSQQYFKWRNIEKPSSYLSVNIDRSELLTEAKLSHRRTPSAGLLGCGQKHSPVAPSPVLRSSASEPVSPVCFGRSVSGLAGGKLPDTHDETPSDFILTVDDEGKGMKTSDVKRLDGRSRQTVSHSASGQKKHRSHSVGSRPRTGNQQALTRTLSTPTSRNVRADSEPKSIPIVNKLEPKNEKFSPYETFTENELTESKEFSGEAVRANNLLSAGDGNPSTRSHSFTRKTSSKSAGGIPTEQEIEVNQRSSKEQKEERMKYENGEKGELHPSFQGPAQELLQFAKDLDTPSVYVQKETLLTRYCVDTVLYELMNLVKAICPDLTSKIYRAVPSNQPSVGNLSMFPTSNYVIYDPIRPPLHASDKKETSVDRAGSNMTTSAKPPPSFVLISRNVSQWRNNLLRLQDSSYVESDKSSMSHKDFYASQQFQSYNWDSHDDANERTKETTSPFSYCTPGFVSRQRLILIDVKDKEITATTYNLSNDTNIQLAARLTRLVNWNNARCHLVSCLFHQKMGLFHHSTFQGLNVGKKEINPFCETIDDHHLFSLLKQTAPNPPDKNANSQKQIPSVGKLLFEETLRDVIPPKPLHTTKHCSYRDPVKRHGAQFQEIRAIQIRTAVQNAELRKLFTSWLAGSFNSMTGDNSINLLKRQSRLVHCCKTPFLACEEWITIAQENASRKVNQEEGMSKKENGQDDGQQLPKDDVKEDEWHYKLREEFISYYTQYIQSQGFALVQLSTPLPFKMAKGQRKPLKAIRKKGSSERSKQPTGSTVDSQLKPLHYFLQKTTDGSKDGETYAYDGGIMLMELGYEGCHFSVKLYAFESCRLLDSSVKQQTKNTFLAECSKVRELTRLNSFSYDFHLRHVQYFLIGQRMVFPKGFRLTSMLTKLMKVFVYPPKFSWNHVCRGQLFLELCSLPRATIFSYIVEHAKKYNLTTVEMKDKEDQEHVLVCSKSQNKLYEVSLLAKLNPNAEENVLGLKFFVVMTHRRELFPKMKAEFPRKKSSGFAGEAGFRQRHAVINTFNSNSSELGHGSTPGPPITEDNFKRSISTPQFATPVPQLSDHMTGSQSDEQLRHFSITSSGSSTSLVSPESASRSSRTNVGKERAYIIKGLESDPSDSLMSWDMRNLENEAVMCCHELYSAVSSAQKDCMRDHLWHLLLKGANIEDTNAETYAWKSKSLRKKTEHRRTSSDFAENWAVPSSLKDVADSKSSISCEDFENLVDIVKPVSLPVVDETLKPFLSMDTAWYISLWSSLLSKFGDRSREFSKCDDKIHYLILLNPKNLDMFIYIYVDEEKRLAEVKIANRTSSDDNKKTARTVPKSCDDFIEEVVNALCYQMWTGLLSS